MKLTGKVIQMCGTLGLVALVGLAGGCGPSSPSPGAKPAVTNTPALSKTNLVPVTQAVKTNQFSSQTNSIFDNKLQNGGKDPFFPYSTRRGELASGSVAKTVLPNSATNAHLAALAANPENALVLSSIVASGGRRLAVINSRTFSVGEELQLRLPSGPLRIRCLEIDSRSVTVSVNDKPERKKIFLKH